MGDSGKYIYMVPSRTNILLAFQSSYIMETGFTHVDYCIRKHTENI